MTKPIPHYLTDPAGLEAFNSESKMFTLTHNHRAVPPHLPTLLPVCCEVGAFRIGQSHNSSHSIYSITQPSAFVCREQPIWHPKIDAVASYMHLLFKFSRAPEPLETAILISQDVVEHTNFTRPFYLHI